MLFFYFFYFFLFAIIFMVYTKLVLPTIILIKKENFYIKSIAIRKILLRISYYKILGYVMFLIPKKVSDCFYDFILSTILFSQWTQWTTYRNQFWWTLFATELQCTARTLGRIFYRKHPRRHAGCQPISIYWVRCSHTKLNPRFQRPIASIWELLFHITFSWNKSTNTWLLYSRNTFHSDYFFDIMENQGRT